jgi:hypothetical protein
MIDIAWFRQLTLWVAQAEIRKFQDVTKHATATDGDESFTAELVDISHAKKAWL